MYKRNQKLVLILLITSIGLQAMGPSQPGASQPTFSTQPLPGTPEKVATENQQKGLTPLSTASQLVQAVSHTSKKKSKENLLAMAEERIVAVNASGPSPRKKLRVEKTAEEFQDVVVSDVLHLKKIASPAARQRLFGEKNFEGHWASPSFKKMSTLSPKAVFPMEMVHIFDGDPDGTGNHFLETPGKLNAFKTGISTVQNVQTEVLFRADEKTALAISDEEAMHKIVQDIAHAPYTVRKNPISPEQFCFGFMPPNIPLEIYLKKGSVKTAYPIFSFTLWQPLQAQIILALIEVGGITKQIAASSDNLLSIAQAVIHRTDKKALRYINNGKIIIDVASDLDTQQHTGITRSMYVEFPLDQFDFGILHNNFSEFFYP